MNILFIFTMFILIISFIFDWRKTIRGLKLALKKFNNIIIPLIIVFILVSIVLYFINKDMISKYLVNKNKYFAFFAAAVFGSVTMMPGFIAFPLGGILKQSGVSNMIISVFTSSLMMVGIITFPVEKKYFGFKVALLRNVIGFLISIIIGIMTGIIFKELLL